MQIAISFDTTGSMFPAISEVKRRVTESLGYLFKSIPDLEIAIIAHGDYCDGDTFYRVVDFTTDISDLTKFINTQTADGGGDAPECYEFVLKNCQYLSWQDAEQKALIMIGDQVPHEPGYNYTGYTRNHKLIRWHNTINWREEAKILGNVGIQIYGVQCLSSNPYNKSSGAFYEAISSISNGIMVELHQFHNTIEMIESIAHKQNDTLDAYEEHLIANRRMNRVVGDLLEKLRGRKSTLVTYKDIDLDAVPPGRFQLLHVDTRIPIKAFVLETGATFNVGRGFYQFTKPETIQERKEVVLRDKVSGDMWTGAKAREMIGLPYGVRGNLKPVHMTEYDVFVQSTSANRILMPGTMFLYEV